MSEEVRVIVVSSLSDAFSYDTLRHSVLDLSFARCPHVLFYNAKSGDVAVGGIRTFKKGEVSSTARACRSALRPTAYFRASFRPGGHMLFQLWIRRNSAPTTHNFAGKQNRWAIKLRTEHSPWPVEAAVQAKRPHRREGLYDSHSYSPTTRHPLPVSRHLPEIDWAGDL